MRFKPLSDQSEDNSFPKENKEVHKVKQTNNQSESKTYDMDSEKRVNEFNKDQNLTDMCMPELVRMVPTLFSNKEVGVSNLEFIKTEDGQMQCLSCHFIFNDKAIHQRQCPKRSDNGEEDNNVNVADEKPENSAMSSPLPSNQLSSCNGIKDELSDFAFYPGIKIEPIETNPVADYTVPSIQKEELLQCSNCKLYFNDRCAYLDHKMFICQNERFDKTTDMDVSAKIDTPDSSETGIKIEVTDDNHFQSDGTQIKTEMTSDYDSMPGGPSVEMEMPINDCQPSFTCSCMSCGAIFDDFFTYSVHKKGCKRPKIGTVIEELNLRKSTCAICKEKFKSKLELSKHMILLHVGSNTQHCTKKRKHPETDSNDDTEKSPATLARGTTRNVKKFKCNFDDCVEKFQTLTDFTSHYAVHLQKVGTGAEHIPQEDVNQDNDTVVLEKTKTERCSVESDVSVVKGILKQQPHSDVGAAKDSHKFPTNGCANSLDSAADMNKHLQSVRGEIFKSLTNISNDKHVHQCQNKGCGLLFQTKDLLKKHIKETHMAASSIPRVDFPDLVQYVCSICSRIFQYIGDVFKHLQKAHGVKDTINSNLYIVEKMNLCMICHVYIDSDNFLDHFKRCQKHNFIKTALHKSSPEAIPFNEIETQTTETIQVCEQESDMGYTKLNNKATKDSTEVSDDLATANYFNSDYLKNYFIHHSCEIAAVVNSYRCNICNLTFPQKNEILAHLVKTHAILKNFSSEISFIGSNYTCKICSFSFQKQNGILTHLIKTHAVLDSLSALETCSKVTGKSIKEIQEHASMLAKGPVIMHFCDFKDCRLLFRTRTTLEKHKTEHFEKACRFCNFKYYKDSDYNTHLNIHALPTINDQITRKCALCDFNYAKTEDYKSHLLSHYNDVKSIYLNEPTRSTAIMYQCHIGDCTAKYENIADLVVHESKFHTAYYSAGSGNKDIIVVPKQQQNVINTVADGNKCKMDNLKNSETCNSSKFVLSKEENDSCKETESTIKSEILDADKEMPSFHTNRLVINEKFDCHVCLKTFLNQQGLSLHLKSCHQIVSLKCGLDRCKAVFPTASALKLHVQRSHAPGTSDIKDNIKACQFCSFRYDSEDSYTQHLSNCHKYNETSKRPSRKKTRLDKVLDLDYNLLPYKCTTKGCSKAYLYHRDLVKHLQTKDHIFPCPKENCNSAFEYPSTLKLHVQQDHGNVYALHEPQKDEINIQKWYMCPAKGCQKVFLNKRNLDQHCTVTHNNLYSEEDFISSGASTMLNEHTVKESQTTVSVDKDNESNLLYTTSGFKIELVDDSNS